MVVHPARVLALVLLAASANAQTALHVDATAPVGGDGTSWGSSFNDLQLALDGARANPSVQEIRVAAGRYQPDRGTLNRDESFMLVDGVQLLGGFPLGGGLAADRDPSRHVTHLSGDLLVNDGAVAQSGFTPGQDENSKHVVRAMNLSPNTGLDGFMVSSGYIDVAFDGSGAGLRVDGGGLRIKDCLFRGNLAAFTGGGVALLDAEGHLEDCRFEWNTAISYGAGASVDGAVSSEFQRCVFENNIGGSGAGLALRPRLHQQGPGNSTHVEDCRFLTNRAAISATAGGGLYAAFSEPSILRCEFLENSANGGGGIFIETGSAFISRCSFVRNVGLGDGGGAISVINFSASAVPATTILSCAILGNLGGVLGAGAPLQIINSTIANNQGPELPPGSPWPAITLQTASHLDLANSIVWGNDTSVIFGDERDHIVISGSASVQVTRSIIEQWAGALSGSGSGLNPRFTDPSGADGDPLTVSDNSYTLRRSSPGLESGLRQWLPAEAKRDVVGKRRIMDGNLDGLYQVDLGAYERPPVILAHAQ